MQSMSALGVVGHRLCGRPSNVQSRDARPGFVNAARVSLLHLHSGIVQLAILAYQVGRRLTCPVFKSRCPFFTPEGAGKGWWDLAESGRPGQGPTV